MWPLEGRKEFRKVLDDIEGTEGGEEVWEKMRDKIREVIERRDVTKNSRRKRGRWDKEGGKE